MAPRRSEKGRETHRMALAHPNRALWNKASNRICRRRKNRNGFFAKRCPVECRLQNIHPSESSRNFRYSLDTIISVKNQLTRHR